MRWFSISGTASRREALLVCGAALLLTLAVLLLDNGAWWRLGRWLAPLAGVAWAALVATLIRRLHDIGRNGAWVLVILATLPWIGFALMAYLLWQRPSRRSYQPSLIGAILGGTVVGLVLFLGLLTLAWRPMLVTSGNMKPTLAIGDRLLVRHARGESATRGDVVLIRHPTTRAEQVYRVIGLAGDRVKLTRGRLLLNGTEVPQTPAGTFSEIYAPQGPHHSLPRCRVQVGLGGLCAADRHIETLPGGHRHAVLDHDTRSGPPDTLPEVTVPEGTLYLLGDNRDASLDSRFAISAGGLGMVPLDLIAGRVDLVLFSSPASRPIYIWSWRPTRLLARIDRIEAE